MTWWQIALLIWFAAGVLAATAVSRRWIGFEVANDQPPRGSAEIHPNNVRTTVIVVNRDERAEASAERNRLDRAD